MAVFAIVLTAPAGAILTNTLGPKWLSNYMPQEKATQDELKKEMIKYRSRYLDIKVPVLNVDRRAGEEEVEVEKENKVVVGKAVVDDNRPIHYRYVNGKRVFVDESVLDMEEIDPQVNVKKKWDHLHEEESNDSSEFVVGKDQVHKADDAPAKETPHELLPIKDQTGANSIATSVVH